MFVETLALQAVVAVGRQISGGRRRVIIQQEFRDAAMAGELRDQRRIVRSKYLHRIGIITSFDSGLLPLSQDDRVELKPMTMVVTEPDLVLMASEIGEDAETEYARLPRASVTGVRVVDTDGNPAPDGLLHPRDELDPALAGTFVMALDLSEGEGIGLMFRSANGAGAALDRLRRYIAA
jgi:hypothetical protein